MKFDFPCDPPDHQPQWPDNDNKQPPRISDVTAVVLFTLFVGLLAVIFCYYGYKALPVEQHISRAIPAGEWKHIPGDSDYEKFVEKNK